MIYYFDNCATTRVDSEVVEILNRFHTQAYFNPSALNSFSAEVATEIKNARQRIANALFVKSEELIFTSGGTEAINTAILGCLKKKQGNIVLCQTEHSAAYNCAMQLKSKGFEIRIASSLPDGHIDVEDFVNLIDENTLLAVMMHINNETGAVNDIKSLARRVKGKNRSTLVFSDGVQAVGKVALNISSLGVDLYSFAGHKIHCSKGIGCLFVKNGTKLSPLIFGGGQQSNLRSGTEYVGGIVALAYSVEKAVELCEENCKKYIAFKKHIVERLDQIGGYKLNCKENCADAILSIAFEGIKAEVLVHMLESHKVIIGTSSACSAKNKQNRVYSAMGLQKSFIDGVVRVSFSKFTTMNEVEFLTEKLCECVTNLRKIVGNKGEKSK